MDRYAKPRRDGPVHRVLVDRGVAFKHEPCNLDDAAYFRLEDERPEGRGCLHCKPDEPRSPEQEEKERAEEQVPALGKSDVPRSLVLIPRRLLVALLLIVALLPFVVGNASGVVLSPDEVAAASSSPSALPTDWERIIELRIDELLLNHLLIDHAPEATPSASASASPGSSVIPTPSPTSAPNGSHGRTSPTASPRPAPTRRPSHGTTPIPSTAPTAAPATPAPTPCFRPGNPQSGKDPCQWPPDDK